METTEGYIEVIYRIYIGVDCCYDCDCTTSPMVYITMTVTLSKIFNRTS